MMWNFLLEDVKMDCIARVPRCYYPTLSLVSKYFHSLVASPELYARRSLLGCTEYCFYVGFCDITSSYMNWYTFRRKTSKNMIGTDKNDNSLVLIPSLPYVPINSTCVVVGSKIYMIGGYYYSKPTSDVSVINCISHTAQPLPRFRKTIAYLAVGSVDEKIYVIDKYEDPRIMVFDTESLTWELGAKSKVETGERVNGSAAMSGKIYMSTAKNGYICHPNEGKWETDQIMNSKEWTDACVLDDILYTYDEYEDSLYGYDLKLKSWKKIKDLKGLPQDCLCSRITCCDSKLVMFFQTGFCSGKTEIWCAEIAVEKHEGGEILGNVEWCDIVLVHHSDLIQCLAVKI